MDDKKKYYWIKLKTDFFNQNEIDFLLTQSHGFKYVVLYQMLCLQTANQNGKLGLQLGDKIIPYDIKKIVRDTKYFDEETVRKALNLFEQLGLICLEADKCFKIVNFENIVGSETQRSKKKKETKRES